jgi:hypothetical protein
MAGFIDLFSACPRVAASAETGQEKKGQREREEQTYDLKHSSIQVL